MAAWSQLPKDLLGLILEKLPLAHYIRFGSVCISWNCAVKDREFRPKSQIPWLMIPNDDDERSARFFSISEKRTYDIPQPDPPIRRRLWIGSSYGWLITVDEECEMHLLNPVTGTQIQLPSITTLPFVDAVSDAQGLHTKFNFINEAENGYITEFSADGFRCFFFLKAVLSSPPSKDGGGDFVVMLIHGPYDDLAFMRSGDKSWTSWKSRLTFQDVIPCGDFFYTSSPNGKIYAWDIHCFSDIQPHSLKPRCTAVGKANDLMSSYLIISQDGEFLVLYREQGGKRDENITFDCKLVTVPKGNDKRKWSRVKDMKDTVIFVGNNHSMSMSALEFPELRRNSIYFTDNNIEYSRTFRRKERDIGIYDIIDNRVKPINDLPPHMTWPPSVWFVPVLF